jgi:hypothetical protein
MAFAEWPRADLEIARFTCQYRVMERGIVSGLAPHFTRQLLDKPLFASGR